MPWNFQHVFNTPWNIQHSFGTCITVFNMHWNFKHTTCITVFRTFWNFQHAFLQFSEHSEIFNMLFYSIQNILKFSTCFFTVCRTYWNFQHAFLQFSEHAENFNMFFYSFQHSFSICFQHALQISTCSEIFNTLSNMKIWNIYSQIVTEPIPKYS